MTCIVIDDIDYCSVQKHVENLCLPSHLPFYTRIELYIIGNILFCVCDFFICLQCFDAMLLVGRQEGHRPVKY